MSQHRTSKQTIFKTKLAVYKKLIDDDIVAYAKEVRRTTLQQYGAQSAVSADSYLRILERGGKRLRGALCMLGYEMSGGENRAMILHAARALELMHAYILIIDDICDRSPTRRGGPTAHEMIAGYHHAQHLSAEPRHFGEAIAMTAALLGSHAANLELSRLDVPEAVRLEAIGILNRTMIVTAHGQFNDMFNEVVSDVSEADVENVLEWKTAHYTMNNPLHMGMVLAGAGQADIAAITPYALHAGKAFQITDDILGTFGTEFESGKDPMDDIREGKRTLLSVYALCHTDDANKNFLIQMLGNDKLTQAQFNRCKEIMVASGALRHAQEAADNHVTAALASLDSESSRWTPDGTRFLRELARYLLERKS